MTVTDRSPIRTPAAWLDAVVEAWFGYSRPAPLRLIEDEAWSPDPADAYCPRCGETVGQGEVTDGGCGACRDHRLRIERTVRLGSYEPPLATWINDFKYAGWAAMGRHLGTRLAESVSRIPELRSTGEVIVVPMPMPWQRRLYRGVDHARIIAEPVARAVGGALMPILTRRNGQPQVGRAAGQRKRSGRAGLGVRWIPGGWDLSGATVVLVDDVRTTGASLEAAGRRLHGIGAQHVVAATLAVTSPHRRSGRRADLEDGSAAEAGSSRVLGRLISKNSEETVLTR